MATFMTAYAILCTIQADYVTAIGFGLFVLMLAIFIYPSQIEIDAQEIRLRSGFVISRRLKLEDIVRIREARVSGALSLKKEPGFLIEGARITLNACVQDPEGLMKALTEFVPDLHLYGDEYRRT